MNELLINFDPLTQTYRAMVANTEITTEIGGAEALQALTQALTAGWDATVAWWAATLPNAAEAEVFFGTTETLLYNGEFVVEAIEGESLLDIVAEVGEALAALL